MFCPFHVYCMSLFSRGECSSTQEWDPPVYQVMRVHMYIQCVYVCMYVMSVLNALNPMAYKYKWINFSSITSPNCGILKFWGPIPLRALGWPAKFQIIFSHEKLSPAQFKSSSHLSTLKQEPRGKWRRRGHLLGECCSGEGWALPVVSHSLMCWTSRGDIGEEGRTSLLSTSHFRGTEVLLLWGWRAIQLSWAHECVL